MESYRRRVGALPIAVCLALAGCSDGDTATTTAAPSTTPAAPTTTTTLAATTSTTTTTAPTTTSTSEAPTTTVTGTAVGDAVALEASIREIGEALTLFYPDLDPNQVPIPDLTNPDPTVAVEAANRWSQWIAANAPSADWAVINTYDDSPERDATEDTSNQLFFQDWFRVRPEGSEWVYAEPVVVELATLTLPPEAIDGVPSDAVAVLYRSSSGPLHHVRQDTGEVVQVVIDGWDWISVAIVAPTPEGWKQWVTIIDYVEEA